jgi:hypothetical protein
MSHNTVAFRVARLDASVPQGIPIVWQGQEISTGPLVVELDDASGESRGVLDYDRSHASVEFRVTLRFPEFSAVLQEQGAPPEMTSPIRGVLRAEGGIRPDHSFDGGLRGSCEIEPHALFSSTGIGIDVLPGY